jgi:drug/metabolite transporter (DMT)-like permease
MSPWHSTRPVPRSPHRRARSHRAHASRHRHERPEDWGWHADLGLLARIGGVVTLIALLLMLTASHYNHAGDVALLFFIGVVVVGLIWDAQKRRNSWRR